MSSEEFNHQQLLPLKKRRVECCDSHETLNLKMKPMIMMDMVNVNGSICSSVFSPMKRSRSSSLDFEWEKQHQQQQPINNNINDDDDDEGFGYRPNKRFCPEFRFKATTTTTTVSSVDHLSALFDYIREPEPEWECRQQLLAENKRKENMKKKKNKKGKWWRKLNGGFNKLRREKVVGLGFGLAKDKVKALFGQFWTGDDQTFKWEIQHYSDPLSLPFR